MDRQEQLQIFQAQTRNVRFLDSGWKAINKQINRGLRIGDNRTIDVQTKLLALLFCSWVEANFSKMIHTPYGFDTDEIDQIKAVQREQDLGSAWKKCIDLGLMKVSPGSKSSYIPNTRRRLFEIVEQFVIEPSIVRNKIAHGQWVVALNRENTAVNAEITNRISKIDAVLLETWFGAHRMLASIVEAMIESPQRAFHRDFWLVMGELEVFLRGAENRSIDQKADLLKMKPIKFEPVSNREHG